MSKEFEYPCPLVVDNGSGMVKAGLAGEDAPRVVFPSVVGRPDVQRKNMINNQKEFYIGDEAQSKRGILNLQYPIEHGIVTDWDNMEKIWHHMFFNELKLDPSEHPILLTETPLNPNLNSEKMINVMFEKFNAPAVQIVNPGLMSLYCSGKTTGIVFGSGESVSYAVPIYDGHIIKDGMIRVEIGGRDINNYLMKLLAQNVYTFKNFNELEIVRNIKEKLCYMSLNYEPELQTAETTDFLKKSYELPDGQVITLGKERFCATRPLIEPTLVGVNSGGIHEIVFNSIMKCNIDVRRDLYENIFISGGNTMFDGLPERLKQDITELAPSSVNVNVIAPPERKYSVWIGGSILASLEAFQEQWISKEEYAEIGPTIIHQKSFLL